MRTFKDFICITYHYKEFKNLKEKENNKIELWFT